MRRSYLVLAAVVAGCSPADHAYYARGKIAQTASDGFAADELERVLLPENCRR